MVVGEKIITLLHHMDPNEQELLMQKNALLKDICI